MNIFRKIRLRLFPPKINKMIFNYQVACARKNLFGIKSWNTRNNENDVYIDMMIKNIDNPRKKAYIKRKRKVQFK